MRKEFESHCQDYNLEYDFTHLGDTYTNHNTHQAYILFKSLQNTSSNIEYEATPKSCRTCINKCSLITQHGCKNNGYFMWEEA